MAKTVLFNRTGGSEVLEIKNIPTPPPAAKEIQIRVRAIGINRAEIMYRTGQYVIKPQFPARLGYEAAGVIEAIGNAVTEFRIGDKVSVIPSFMFDQYSMYGELVNAPVHAIVKHPENLSFEEAAASWMMFVTAYGALIEYGRLKQGQYVIINAASSSVGVAAIQIANIMGAHPIALTRTNHKKNSLLKLGAHAVIATSEQNLTKEILQITNNEGAHIVFDPIGGANVAKITAAMAMNSIFFQYGALDTENLSIPVMDILGKHLTFRGYELFEITTHPEKLQKAKDFVYNGLQSGQLKPTISKIFPFDDIAKAHEYMEENTQIGKVVVKI